MIFEEEIINIPINGGVKAIRTVCTYTRSWGFDVELSKVKEGSRDDIRKELEAQSKMDMRKELFDLGDPLAIYFTEDQLYMLLDSAQRKRLEMMDNYYRSKSIDDHQKLRKMDETITILYDEIRKSERKKYEM